MARRIRNAPSAAAPEPLRWLEAGKGALAVRGLPWRKENGGGFARLPLRLQKKVRPPVWDLGRHSAGACVAFRSDASRMSLRLTTAAEGHMLHMPYAGSNGAALYAAEAGEPPRWWATAFPVDHTPATELARELFAGVAPRMREFRLYLPLYMETLKVSLGVPKGARVLAPTPPRVAKPVVLYGSSIMQGGCAATPGTDGVALLSRRLDFEAVNLGFSGNGRGEPEIAGLMAEVDAALYVLDYVPNTAAERGAELKKTLPGFVRILQRKRPRTPVLLVSGPAFGTMNWNRDAHENLHACRDYMMGFYAGERAKGNANLHFVDGFSLVPRGADPAYVDGVHPTDAGFDRWARGMEPPVASLLGASAWR